MAVPPENTNELMDQIQAAATAGENIIVQAQLPR